MRVPSNRDSGGSSDHSVSAIPTQGYLPARTMPVLVNDHLDRTGGMSELIEFMPEQHDRVRILFDLAGIAQVGHRRSPIAPIHRTAIQLRRENNGETEFHCQPL